MVVARMRLEVARRRGPPEFTFVGKSRTTQVRCVPLEAARVAARCERDLSMESCLVALSTASGEGLSGREPYTGSIMVHKRGAIT